VLTSVQPDPKVPSLAQLITVLEDHVEGRAGSTRTRTPRRSATTSTCWRGSGSSTRADRRSPAGP
jgi:hypothetical protein